MLPKFFTRPCCTLVGLTKQNWKGQSGGVSSTLLPLPLVHNLHSTSLHSPQYIYGQNGGPLGVSASATSGHNFHSTSFHWKHFGTPFVLTHMEVQRTDAVAKKLKLYDISPLTLVYIYMVKTGGSTSAVAVTSCHNLHSTSSHWKHFGTPSFSTHIGSGFPATNRYWKYNEQMLSQKKIKLYDTCNTVEYNYTWI